MDKLVNLTDTLKQEKKDETQKVDTPHTPHTHVHTRTHTHSRVKPL